MRSKQQMNKIGIQAAKDLKEGHLLQTAAVIANKACAELYELDIFEENIQDLRNNLKKAISPACGGVRAPGFPKGRAPAPLGSPSARVSRAGEIVSVKKLGRWRPSFLSLFLAITKYQGD